MICDFSYESPRQSIVYAYCNDDRSLSARIMPTMVRGAFKVPSEMCVPTFLRTLLRKLIWLQRTRSFASNRQKLKCKHTPFFIPHISNANPWRITGHGYSSSEERNIDVCFTRVSRDPDKVGSPNFSSFARYVSEKSNYRRQTNESNGRASDKWRDSAQPSRQMHCTAAATAGRGMRA